MDRAVPHLEPDLQQGFPGELGVSYKSQYRDQLHDGRASRLGGILLCRHIIDRAFESLGDISEELVVLLVLGFSHSLLVPTTCFP